MKFALVLILALLLAGCSDNLPEAGAETPDALTGSAAVESASLIDSYKIEPIGAEGDVAACFELEIENESFDSSRDSDRIWSMKIPAIISDKPGAAALNEKIYNKYTSQYKREITELTETGSTETQRHISFYSERSEDLIYIEVTTRKLAAGQPDELTADCYYYDPETDRELTAREYFDLYTGDEVTLADCAAQFSRLYEPTSEDDLIEVAPYGEYVIVTFSQGTMYFNRTIPYPDPSELPESEPICEGKAFMSRVSFRIYSEQPEPTFYWSDDGSTWFRYILPLPEGCESGRVFDCGGGAGSGEGMVYLEAMSGGETKYYAYLSYTHVLPITFAEPQEIGIEETPSYWNLQFDK